MATRSRPLILVADDDKGILRIVSKLLSSKGFRVVTRSDGLDALRIFRTDSVALALLDIRMPEIDGLHLCEIVRAESDVPIVMMTVLDDDSDAILAIGAGADDFIRKPFDTADLLARVGLVLRSREGLQPAQKLSLGPLMIDEDQQMVVVHGREVLLSKTEFSLIDYMARNVNRVLSHEQLLERVWGPDFIGADHLLRVTMSRLRRRINDDSGTIIETCPGVGYRVRRHPANTSPF